MMFDSEALLRSVNDPAMFRPLLLARIQATCARSALSYVTDHSPLRKAAIAMIVKASC